MIWLIHQFNTIEVKPNPCLSWAWPSSAPASCESQLWLTIWFIGWTFRWTAHLYGTLRWFFRISWTVCYYWSKQTSYLFIFIELFVLKNKNKIQFFSMLYFIFKIWSYKKNSKPNEENFSLVTFLDHPLSLTLSKHKQMEEDEGWRMKVFLNIYYNVFWSS